MAYITGGSGLTQDDLGMPTVGRPNTASLFVKKDATGAADGSSWADAFTTLNAALDAASTDPNEGTLIFLAPAAAPYDIDTTGTPTWTGNYEIHGAHRRWSIITNSNATADCIFKFTGKVSINDCGILTANTHGVIFTNSNYRIRHSGLNGTAMTTSHSLIYIDGSGGLIKGGIIEDIEMTGDIGFTTGIYMDKATQCTYKGVYCHTCINAIQIVDVLSINNYWEDLDLGGNAIGINIDAGVSQHFNRVNFHENTINVDDEVGEHHYNGITGELGIHTTPQDRVGVSVVSGADAYGADTELVAIATVDVPFKVLFYNVSPSVEETMMIRFSADSGATYFTESVFATKKDKASGGGDATNFIFNAGTRISASLYGSAITVNSNVWLEIQEI